jgi:hypothetical protein
MSHDRKYLLLIPWTQPKRKMVFTSRATGFMTRPYSSQVTSANTPAKGFAKKGRYKAQFLY